MIRLSEPYFAGNEVAYVTEALHDKQPCQGPFVDHFETAFAEYVGSKYAVSCSSGTAGLHLALLALGLGPGDRVIVPAITYVATANAAAYCKAVPALVDIDPTTWGLPQSTSPWTPAIKAVICTHLYGRVAKIPQKQEEIPIVVDACEALGADLKEKLGDVGVFSCYGNKVITTGEGGMVVTDNPWLADRLRFYRGQGQSERRYYHTEVGYNYRMSNLSAALGLAQLETIDEHLAKRWKVVNRYCEAFSASKVMAAKCGVEPRLYFARPDAPWLFTFTVNPNDVPRDEVMRRLTAKGIETRPTFVPLHRLPMYRESKSYPNAEYLGDYGLSLPTHAGLTDEQVAYIVRCVNEALR
jgi:perosamine synthetase